jgi:hypothetical protein
MRGRGVVVYAARIDFDVADMNGAPAFFARDNSAGVEMTYASHPFAPFQRLHTASLPEPYTPCDRADDRSSSPGRVVDGGATFYFAFSVSVLGGSP